MENETMMHQAVREGKSVTQIAVERVLKNTSINANHIDIQDLLAMVNNNNEGLRFLKKNVQYIIKKHTKSPKMNTQNCIKNILNNKGFKQVVPTEDFLNKAEITIHRFNKILENKVQMTLQEAGIFSAWLGVSIEELTATPTQESVNLAGKFGLNQ